MTTQGKDPPSLRLLCTDLSTRQTSAGGSTYDILVTNKTKKEEAALKDLLLGENEGRKYAGASHNLPSPYVYKCAILERSTVQWHILHPCYPQI